MQGMIKSFSTVFVVGNILLQNAGYSIVQIEEEETPLYAGPGDPYYLLAITAMLLLLLTACLITYLVLCDRYRRRIRELDAQNHTHLGWKLWKLRGIANELELQKAESLIQKMQESFQQNLNQAETFCGMGMS